MVEPALPTTSGNSNQDCLDMLELAAVAGPASSGEAVAVPPLVLPLAAESDNEADEAISDEPTPKFRKLSCSEPTSAVRVSSC